MTLFNFPYKQKAKVLRAFFAKRFVVQLMRPCYFLQVRAVNLKTSSQPLVNYNIMKNKIGGAIGGNAQAYPEIVIERTYANGNTNNGNGCKEYPKEIIFLKSLLGLVVRLMQVPEQAVHNVLMRKPGHALHKNKRQKEDAEIKHCS